MQRGYNNPVTDIPVLIPVEWPTGDGTISIGRGGQTWRELFPAMGWEFGARHERISVRRFTEKDFEAAIGELNEFGHSEGNGRQLLLARIGLAKALEKKDEIAVQNALRMLWHEPRRQKSSKGWESLFGAVRASGEKSWSKKKPQHFLAAEITEGLAASHLVVWWTGDRYLPAVFCEDRETALYVWVALTLAGGGKSLGICPQCSVPFVRERSDQIYCSVQHREAHRVARWRARKKRQKGSLKTRRKVKRR